MARHPDKEKKLTEILTKHDGRTEGIEGDMITVSVSAHKDREFQAEIKSAGMGVYRIERPAGAIDINWYAVDVS
jgi:hypothetical protein